MYANLLNNKHFDTYNFNVIELSLFTDMVTTFNGKAYFILFYDHSTMKYGTPNCNFSLQSRI